LLQAIFNSANRALRVRHENMPVQAMKSPPHQKGAAAIVESE